MWLCYGTHYVIIFRGEEAYIVGTLDFVFNSIDFVVSFYLNEDYLRRRSTETREEGKVGYLLDLDR